MDPITQGVVGAALPQSNLKQTHLFLAGLFGLIGGMAPDLDSFIRSEQDPLLYLEFHRQFSHSLFFIPIGGLLCSALMHLLIGRRHGLSFKRTYLFCTLGYATHGLLDAVTSYGTMLFWPFSDARVSLSFISIVDPIFTLPILTLVLLAAFKKKTFYARSALCWAALYLSLGAYQNHSAQVLGYKLANKRGHKPINLSVKPSFGNLLVWKSIYQNGDIYYVDALRVGLTPTIYQGTSIQSLNIKRDFPWLDENSQQAKDIERFRWFSKGYLAQSPTNPNQIIDLRYSMLPNKITGLWFIELSPDAKQGQHVDFITDRKVGPEQRKALWQMIIGSKD